MMLRIRTILALAATLLLPLTTQGEGSWNLKAASSAFEHAKAAENAVSILHDGWYITFLAHDGEEIGAAIIMAQKEDADHEYDLSETVSRTAELAGMEDPEAMEFEEDREAAILVDQAIMSALAEETEDVFDGSALAAIAYLLDDGFFVINGIRDNGYIHWKTARKSGVELLMPVVGKKLTAIEVTGRQQLDDYASEVLASKLGFGKNTVPLASREALCNQLQCNMVPYMNTKDNVLLARTNRKAVIGKRQAVGSMLSRRNAGAVSFPNQVSEWPESGEDESEDEEVEDKPEPAAEDKPLTPAEAREAYIRYVQSL